MTDRAIRILTAATVLLVALIAAVVSYEHLYHLSVTHGEPRLDAALIPVATDGTVVAASLVMLRAARLGLPTPWLARLMLVLSVATTLAANMAFGWSWSVWGVILAGAPVVWFVGNAESVIGFGRKTRAVPPAVPVAIPATRPLPSVAGIRKRQACNQETAEKARAEVQLDRRSRGGDVRVTPRTRPRAVPAARSPAGAAAPTAPAGAAPSPNGRSHA